MPGDSATATGKSGRRVTHRSTPNGTASQDGTPAFQPELGTRYEFDCPVCGDGEANATYKLGHDGDPRWFVNCWTLACRDLGAAYLDDLADCWGLPPGETPEGLAKEARALGRKRHRSRPVEPWSDEQHREWCEALLSAPAALAYVTTERPLTVADLRRERIGYAPSGTGTPPWPKLAAFVFPCRKKRFWPVVPEKAKCVAVTGSAATLDVEPPPGRSLLVCEGEFDAAALRARAHGFPAVTSTAGTSWSPDWNRHVVGRYVAVMYDAGADSLEIAERRAREFVAAGAREAWAVNLGLDKGEDATDWFVTYGRTADDLRALIRAARRSA